MPHDGRRPRTGTRASRHGRSRRSGGGAGIVALAIAVLIGGGVVYYVTGRPKEQRSAATEAVSDGTTAGAPEPDRSPAAGTPDAGAAAASPAPAARAAGVVDSVPAPKLVEGGRAVGEFVLAPGASKDETFAVNDMRHWLKEMTGASVPVLASPTGEQNTKVFVGKGFASKYQDDLAKLAGTDGFAIRRHGRSVHVFGDRPRGTAFGVFSLLERNTDLIWARPNEEFGTVFGRHEDIVLSDTDVLDVPVFLHRSISGGHPPHQAGAEWLMRNRINRVGRRQFNGAGWDMQFAIGNNLYFELKKHAKEHPEWFGYDPLNKRRVVGAGEGTLCLTRPGLPGIWARAIAKKVRAEEERCGRKIETYTIGPGDNWFCCCCSDCLKPIDLPDGSVLRMKHQDSIKDPLFRSTQYHMFLNRAMKTWKKEIPHVKPVSLAYIYLAEPPAVELDPDLWIFFAPYPTNSMHFPLLDPRQPKQWRVRFEKWRKKTKNFGFYEYYFSKPSPQGFYAAANLRALLETGEPKKAFIYSEYTNDRGTTGIGEGALGWDVGAMNTWVIMRLFWDPKQDVDALYRYYIERAYRDAAPAMTRYYELIKASWLDPKDTTVDSCHVGLSHVYDGMVVKKGLEPKVRKLLAEAEAAATNPGSKRMIQRMRARFSAYTKGMARLVVPHIEEMAYDGHTFASVQWEKPEALDDFRVTTRLGKAVPASSATKIKAGHDRKNLYIRFTAVDESVRSVKVEMPEGEDESWPGGDHAEIWFSPNWMTSYVFAFDSDGNAYDAKNLDRTWNSGWRLIAEKTDTGWEAIAVIPLKPLSLTPGKKTGLKWFATRTIDHGTGKIEEISYQGLPLYNKFFPIVME